MDIEPRLKGANGGLLRWIMKCSAWKDTKGLALKQREENEIRQSGVGDG